MDFVIFGYQCFLRALRHLFPLVGAHKLVVDGRCSLVSVAERFFMQSRKTRESAGTKFCRFSKPSSFALEESLC